MVEKIYSNIRADVNKFDIGDTIRINDELLTCVRIDKLDKTFSEYVFLYNEENCE